MSAQSSLSIDEVLREIIKTGKVVIGFRKTIKYVKTGRLKAVVVARNIPREMFSEIIYNAKLSEIPAIIYEGGSMDLGASIGRPFPVSSIGIIDPGTVSIERIRELASRTS
ncbi:MAG: 50S ribosomal protein L30e [Sulfolobales archaeon]